MILRLLRSRRTIRYLMKRILFGFATNLFDRSATEVVRRVILFPLLFPASLSYQIKSYIHEKAMGYRFQYHFRARLR